MKNTFGNSVAITWFGESHGDYIGAVLLSINVKNVIYFDGVLRVDRI